VGGIAAEAGRVEELGGRGRGARGTGGRGERSKEMRDRGWERCRDEGINKISENKPVERVKTCDSYPNQ
jgi:hypothetical protein